MSIPFVCFVYFVVISSAAILKRQEMLAKFAPVCVRTRTGRRKVWDMPEKKAPACAAESRAAAGREVSQ